MELHAQTVFLAAIRQRIRVTAMVIVAVVVSMTMHHGAMASSPALGTTMAHHHSDHGDCEGACLSDAHGVVACCGMGLCLSALPVAAIASMPAYAATDHGIGLLGVIPRQAWGRIDRPPKFLEQNLI